MEDDTTKKMFVVTEDDLKPIRKFNGRCETEATRVSSCNPHSTSVRFLGDRHCHNRHAAPLKNLFCHCGEFLLALMIYDLEKEELAIFEIKDCYLWSLSTESLYNSL